MALTTLADAKAALGITDTTDDVLFTRLIAECSALFADMWRLPAVPAVTATKTLPVDGMVVWVPFASAVTAVTDLDNNAYSFTAIPGENAGDSVRWVELGSCVHGHVKVTGTFGLAAYPAYVTAAAIETVKVWYMRAKVGGPGSDTSYIGRFEAIPRTALDLMSPLNIVRL